LGQALNVLSTVNVARTGALLPGNVASALHEKYTLYNRKSQSNAIPLNILKL